MNIGLRSDGSVHLMCGTLAFSDMLAVGYKLSTRALSTGPIFKVIVIVLILGLRFFS